MNNFSQNVSFVGLGTYTFVAPFAASFFFEGKMTIPTLTNGGGVSSLLVVVNLNGSPVYTGIAGAEGFRTDIACALADVVTIVLSSADTPDQGLNVIKSTFSIGSGT